jgi:hypothetical protein
MGPFMKTRPFSAAIVDDDMISLDEEQRRVDSWRLCPRCGSRTTNFSGVSYSRDRPRVCWSYVRIKHASEHTGLQPIVAQFGDCLIKLPNLEAQRARKFAKLEAFVRASEAFSK